MFTGLIQDLGEVSQIRQGTTTWELGVRTAFDTSSLELGESIAIDGACLTVTRVEGDVFFLDVSPETLEKTTLGARRVGDKVHLERALRLADRLGGHIVQGHVDGVGTVRSNRREGNAWFIEVDAPDTVARYMIHKGSIAVDGVSLTVNWIEGQRFGLAIIPHTADKTKLASMRAGQQVNLEADLLGKYVERFMQLGGSGQHGEGLTLADLAAAGFGGTESS